MCVPYKYDKGAMYVQHDLPAVNYTIMFLQILIVIGSIGKISSQTQKLYFPLFKRSSTFDFPTTTYIQFSPPRNTVVLN